MKAALFHKYGPPEVVHVGEAEKPEPGRKDLLVRVHAATVNRNDCGFRTPEYPIIRLFAGLTKPRFHILGTEFAGVVEAVGPEVKGFRVGDRVYGRKADERMGAHAEYMTIREDRAVEHMPENLTFEQAAAVPDGTMLATSYLNKVDFSTNPVMLINGASGSIGSAGVQLAKLGGAHVTAVCKTESMEAISALGPDRLIDYKKEDFTKMDHSFDVLFDAVGKSSFTASKHVINEGGFYMSSELGPGWENPRKAIRTALFGGKKKVYFPLPGYKKHVLTRMKKLIEEGKYMPVIDRVYPLDDIVEAHKYVETGEKIGNVVVRVKNEK